MEPVIASILLTLSVFVGIAIFVWQIMRNDEPEERAKD